MSDFHCCGLHRVSGRRADPICLGAISNAADAQNIIFLPGMFRRGAPRNMPVERRTGAASRVDKHVGAKIKSRRQGLGFSVRDTAAHCLLPVALVEDIEQGGLRPTAKTLLELASYLNVPLSFFFEGLTQ